jgi:hypothetical protein
MIGSRDDVSGNNPVHEVPMTDLRKLMIEELERPNYSASTTRAICGWRRSVIAELPSSFRRPPKRRQRRLPQAIPHCRHFVEFARRMIFWMAGFTVLAMAADK